MDSTSTLPGVIAWFDGWNAWKMFVFCVFLTIGCMYLLGILFENRILPMGRRKQFASFVPGDVFLSWTVGLLVARAQDVGYVGAWYTATPVQALILSAVLAGTLKANADEFKEGLYARSTWLTATKLYHNVFLFAFLGYLAIMALCVCITGLFTEPDIMRTFWFFAWLVPGGVWVALVANDGGLPLSRKRELTYFSHVPRNELLLTGGRFRGIYPKGDED